MNTEPEAMLIGPPTTAGKPIGIGKCMGSPKGPLSCNVPSGIDQTILRVATSIAEITP
jgi:hypothetical protein